MAKLTKEELVKELVETLNANEEYNDVDAMQDRMDERDEAIQELLDGQGFTGQSEGDGNEEFDELWEHLKDKVVYVPAHWEIDKKAK